MSLWTEIRDAVQAVGSVAGNYFLPGSSVITGQLVSQGAQEHLGSNLGRLANMGAGFGGVMQGNLGNYGKFGGSSGEAASGASGYTGDGEWDFTPSGDSGASLGMAPTTDWGTVAGPQAPGTWGGFADEAWGLGSAFMQGGGVGGYLGNLAGMGGGSGNALGGLWNLGSGAYGIYASAENKRKAEALLDQADPMARYRPGYAAQLQALMNNPSLMTQMPGYRAGEVAVGHAAAAGGQGGSNVRAPMGGMAMRAYADYGNSFFNNQVAQLGGLSTGSPGMTQLGLMQGQNSLENTMNSLGLIGKGLIGNQPQIPRVPGR